MLTRFRGYALVLLFVVINLAFATAASAGLDDDMCWDETGIRPCCTSCILFCDCRLE